MVCEAMTQGIRLRSSGAHGRCRRRAGCRAAVPMPKPSRVDGKRHPGMIDEAALRGEARLDTVSPELGQRSGAVPAAPAAPPASVPRTRSRASGCRSGRCPAITVRSARPPRHTRSRRSPRSTTRHGTGAAVPQRAQVATGGGQAQRAAQIVIGMPGPQRPRARGGRRQKLRRLANVERPRSARQIAVDHRR